VSRADLTKEPHEVAAMFDAVAARYDVTNDVLSLGQTRLWRRAVARAVDAQPGARVLDLAAGTGSSSLPFAAAGAFVVPCDFSQGMLRVGKQAHPELAFVAGDALRLPFADASFDAVTISFGLRNVSDIDAALAEMARVTLASSRSAAPVSTTLRSAKEIVTASNASSANGSRSASPATSGTVRPDRRPTRSMPVDRSAPTAYAPERPSSSVDTPVPAPTSSTRSPGRNASAARVARRQPRSCPKESTVLVRSYRSATPSNISATSCGCLSRSARDTLYRHLAVHRTPADDPTDERVVSHYSSIAMPEGGRKNLPLVDVS
jgi:SAM-dependent methyltransferase